MVTGSNISHKVEFMELTLTFKSLGQKTIPAPLWRVVTDEKDDCFSSDYSMESEVNYEI